jgi:hypothetical protein
MKKMNQTTENQAEIALRTCLERAPFLRIESEGVKKFDYDCNVSDKS